MCIPNRPSSAISGISSIGRVASSYQRAIFGRTRRSTKSATLSRTASSSSVSIEAILNRSVFDMHSPGIGDHKRVLCGSCDVIHGSQRVRREQHCTASLPRSPSIDVIPASILRNGLRQADDRSEERRVGTESESTQSRKPYINKKAIL